MGLSGLAQQHSHHNKALKLLLPGLVFLCCSSTSHAVLAPKNSITFTTAPNIKATISIEDNNAVAEISNIGRQVLVNNIASVPQYARDMWIDDFNFDGSQDVALTTKIDTASQDQFYTIFIWESGLQHFVPLSFKGQLCNIELDEKRKEIRSSYKTGDHWTEDTYRFAGKQPYLYSRSELLTIDLWHTTSFDRSGQQIRSLISADGSIDSPPDPVIMPVISSSASLYSDPLPSTRLPIEIAHGQQVTLVDLLHGPGNFDWVYIRTNLDNQPIQGWMLLSNLLPGNF